MALSEFIALTKKELDEFAANWRKQHAAKPDQWPMEMGEGDWFEQFMTCETTPEMFKDNS